MSYTIYKTNGLQLLTLLDGTLDSSTGLNLVGKNYINYGTVQNENFVWLLENQANATPPQYPLTGQLWYDTGTSTLKYYDGSTFHPLAAAGSSSTDVGALEAELQTSVTGIYASLTANVSSLLSLVTASNTGMKSYVDSNAVVQSAQILAANTAVNSLQANLSSFYSWANVNYGTSNYSDDNVAGYLPTSPVITGINSSLAGANAAASSANIAMQLYVNDLNNLQISRVTGANAAVSALSANVGSFYTWANTNFGTSNYANADVAAYLVTSAIISDINSNVANVAYDAYNANVAMKNYVDTANAAISARFVTGSNNVSNIATSLISFFTYANATYSTTTYSNTNAEAYLTTSAFIANINSNVANVVYSVSNANTAMKNYVDDRFTSANSNITTANLYLQGYTTSAVNIANVGLKGYVDTRFNSSLANVANIVSSIATLVSNAASQAGDITTLYATTGTHTTQISSLQSNVGSFYTWANTTPNTASNTTTIATTAFVQHVLPTGGIILWHGSNTTIPYGWALCDGNNGTPNLSSPASGVYYIKKTI